MTDAFDLFWQWADKPLESELTIDSTIHHAVTAMPIEDRRDRAKVNAAVARALETKKPDAERDRK